MSLSSGAATAASRPVCRSRAAFGCPSPPSPVCTRFHATLDTPSTRREQMIYSESLSNQHLAYAVSDDLYTWEDQGPLRLAVSPAEHPWLGGRYGAPYVWREPSGCFLMALMGEYSMSKTAYHQSAIGLLASDDGEVWDLAAARRVEF